MTSVVSFSTTRPSPLISLMFCLIATSFAAERVVDDFSELGPWRKASGNVNAPFQVEGGNLSVDMPFRDDQRDMFGLGRALAIDLAPWKSLHMKVFVPKKSSLTFEWTVDGKLNRPLSYRPGKGEWEEIDLPITGEKLTGLNLSFGESGVTNTGTESRTTKIGRIWLSDQMAKVAAPPAPLGSKPTGVAPRPSPEVFPVPTPIWADGEKAAVRLFVSPDGGDQLSGLAPTEKKGSGEGPFKTLARAQKALRDLIAKGALNGTAVVEIGAGVYELGEPLTFTAQDSGKVGAPIIWRAKKGESVRLIGGQVVGGFKPVTGAALQRLDPSARGKVFVSDLKAQGLTRYGELKNGPSWGNSDTGMELFYADRPMTLARYPNEGWMRIADTVVDDGFAIHGQKGSKVGKFTVKDERVKNWVDEPQIMTEGYWFWDWADQRFMVSEIDGASLTITLSNASHNYGFRRNQWFYAFNLLPELDAPGEWYCDRDKGLLYFWPPSPLEKGIAMVSVLSNLMTLDGVQNLEFRFLTLECCQDTAVVAKGLANVKWAGCTLRNTGSYGMTLEGEKIAVVGCDIYQTGDGGVSVTGGDRKTLGPALNLVENCHIHHYGRWDAMYKGGIHINGVGNSARRNLIHDGPHTAIFWSGNEITMELNEIHSVVYESGDAGAIYSGRDWTMRGTRVRHNFFHHIYGFEGRGANGVYFDDQYSSAEMVGNILWKVPKGLLAGGGRDHLISGNIFVECDKAIHFDARGLGWSAPGSNDLIKKFQAMPTDRDPWKSRYPKLPNILNEDPMAPVGNWIDRNITWRCEGNAIEGRAAPYLGWGTNLVEVNPLFVDEKAGDFRLKPGSPATAMGFDPIPTDRIGIYNDPYRATWPVVNEVRAGKLLSAQANPHPAGIQKIGALAALPALNGQEPDRSWQGATALVLAETPNRDTVKNPARAQVTRVGSHLLVSVTIPVSDVAKIQKAPQWGKSDGVEVCFRLHEGIDYRPGPTFVVQGFPGGDKSGSVFGRSAEDAGTRMALATKVAAQIGVGSWTVQFDIPLEMAGIEVTPGMKLGFNIGVRRTGGNEWLAWGGTLGANHNLANGRILVLE